ncbi:MAG: leucyl aminopeptidase [Verrucomicrobia bacterium]|nr:leucyl aminopeptidase [Verrucomicrobiota bacterium]
MKLTVSTTAPIKAPADTLVVALTEKPKTLPRPVAALDKALHGAISEALKSGELTGKRNAVVAFRAGGKVTARKVLCAGLGPAGKVTLEHARQAAAVAAKVARESGARTVALVLETFDVPKAKPAEVTNALAEGVLLSQYKFDRFKKKADNAKRLTGAALLVAAGDLAPARQAVRHAGIVCRAVLDARDLTNLPGNELNPAKLAAHARALARAHGLKCRVLEGRQLETNKLAGVLAVGAGSTNPPRFIIVEYTPARSKGKPLVLVGKGVTFDSGGLSLKPSDAMMDMKTDMGGASAVLNTMAVVAQLKPKFPVVALIPAVENMPSGTASRPGDIIRYASGQTVEIANTDAEGRLILADALLWAKRYKPAAVIDLATLTGACIIALGEHAIALFATEPALAKQVENAGNAVFERVWPMPLWDDYEPQLESEVADARNIGGRPAGTITAALFLNKFVDGAYPWAHLDIAGTATTDKERPYTRKGATGVGVRLLTNLISNWT